MPSTPDALRRRMASRAWTLAALFAVPTLAAQARLSERAQIAQTVDGAVITLDYARPRLRGRTQIFGRQVHHGEVWTPGANMATTIEVSRDVEIDGHLVARGTYSIWFVVDRGEEWTMVLDTVWSVFHTVRPPERGGQVRFPVRTLTGPPTEVLTFDFPEVSDTGAVLRFAWEERVIRVSINVRPAPADGRTGGRADGQ